MSGFSHAQAQWLIQFMRNLPGGAPAQPSNAEYEEAALAQRQQAEIARAYAEQEQAQEQGQGGYPEDAYPQYDAYAQEEYPQMDQSWMPYDDPGY